MIEIALCNLQDDLTIDVDLIERAVRLVLADANIDRADLSLAVVDDATIREVHRDHSNDDTPTDVLSFLFARSETRLDGEIVVSADTARRSSVEYGWTPQDELLLYVIHGLLHLVGHDDATPGERARMQDIERDVLSRLGRDARHEKIETMRED